MRYCKNDNSVFPYDVSGGFDVLIIVDRFEGEWALLEYSGSVFRFPRALLPADLREGDALVSVFTVDEDATANRRETIRKLEDELFK